MHHEKYKTKMHLFDMNFREKNHHLNLLCGANLSDDELRIVMREKQQKISQTLFWQFCNIKQYYQ